MQFISILSNFLEMIAALAVLVVAFLSYHRELRRPPDED